MEKSSLSLQIHRRLIVRERVYVLGVLWRLVLKNHRRFTPLPRCRHHCTETVAQVLPLLQVRLPIRLLLMICDSCADIIRLTDVYELFKTHGARSFVVVAGIHAINTRFAWHSAFVRLAPVSIKFNRVALRSHMTLLFL